MLAHTGTPNDRATFNKALSAVLSEHEALRQLAETVSAQPLASADAATSMAEALAVHERTEARLFALPFLPRMPKNVSATAARAQQCCNDYTSGKARQEDPAAAAALFANALLEHLSVEEAWLAEERAQKNQRMWTSI